MSDPSAFEQLMLEYINRARMDPQGEFDRFIVSTSPVQAIEPGINSALNYFDVDLALYLLQLAGLQAAAPLAWSCLWIAARLLRPSISATIAGARRGSGNRNAVPSRSAL